MADDYSRYIAPGYVFFVRSKRPKGNLVGFMTDHLVGLVAADVESIVIVRREDADTFGTEVGHAHNSGYWYRFRFRSTLKAIRESWKL